MRFRILGPLEAHPHTPSATKQRVVLACLLVDADRLVSTDTLIEELWGAAPPRTARSTLQVYVSHVRKAIAGDGPGSLHKRPSGYRLETAPGELDLHCFQELSAAGDRFYAAGDYERAAHDLHGALALWNGPALADLPQGTHLRPAADRLDLMRLTAWEQRISADIWLGRHRQVIPELTELTRAFPLRESLHSHLIVALQRCHRMSEALTCYAGIRARLADELGVDPSRGLRELHLRLLHSTEVFHFEECLRPTHSAAAPAAGPSGHTPHPAPVVHLPRPLHGPVAHREELDRVESVLRDTPPASQPSIVAVTGGPGVGKSALVTELAHRTGDIFPDGRVLITLRRPGRERLTPSQVLLYVLRKIAPDEAARCSAVPAADAEELTDALCTVLRGRRTLLVLDDVHEEAQIQPLTLTDATLLVTSSRTALTLETAHGVRLGPLSPEESVALLSHIAAPAALEDPAAVEDIARLCEHLPLALRAAAAWLDAHPFWPARALVRRLESPTTRLDALAVGHYDVRARLLAVYQDLPPRAQRALRLMALAPVAGFEPWCAAALLDTASDGGAGAEDAVEVLFQARLLHYTGSTGRLRYRLDGMTHALAMELLAAGDKDHSQDTRAAVRRLSAAYIARARQAQHRIAPGRRPRRTADPAPAVLLPAGGSPALRWFREEHPALLEIARTAHAAGLWDQVGALAEGLVGFYEAAALWEPWSVAADLALDAARRAADPGAEAAALCAMGTLAWQRHQLDASAACFGLALRRARQAHHQPTVAAALTGLADTEYGWGKLASARSLYGKAVALCRAADDPHSLCDALRGMALVELGTGDVSAALGAITEYGAIARAAGDRRWVSFADRTAAWLRDGEGFCDDALEIRPGIWSLPGPPHPVP